MTLPDAPAMPHRWRPFRSRVALAAVAVGLLVAMVALGFAVIPGRGVMTTVDRVSLLLFWLVAMAVFAVLARPHVDADDAGLLVVNLLRRRRLEWAEVLGLRFSRHDAWVVLDLSDGSTLAVMGIQRSDGARGEHAARELAAAVRAHQPGPAVGG